MGLQVNVIRPFVDLDLSLLAGGMIFALECALCFALLGSLSPILWCLQGSSRWGEPSPLIIYNFKIIVQLL